jgi:hypothetical protein
MPSRLQVLRRQLAVEVPKLARASVPVLGELNDGQRLFGAFFAAIIVGGLWDGFRQAMAFLQAILRRARRLAGGKRDATSVGNLPLGSLADSIKVLVIIACAIVGLAGAVIVAGGGAFGGAGATLRF